MKAKKKPLDLVPLADLDVAPVVSLNVISYEAPEQRQKGIMVDDAAALVAALKDKGLL